MFGQTKNQTMVQAPKKPSSQVELKELASDLLLIGVKIKESSDVGRPESLQKLCHSYFSNFEELCQKNGYPPKVIQAAQFALAAYLDELILEKGGDLNQYWSGQSLTVQYFNDPVAGETFFKRLESLLSNLRDNIGLLEIYYLCLALGFQGHYKIRGPEKLPTIIENLLKRIESVTGKSSRVWSPSANVAPGQKPSEGGGKKWLILGALILFLGVVFYGAMIFTSESVLESADPVIKEMENLFY